MKMEIDVFKSISYISVYSTDLRFNMYNNLHLLLLNSWNRINMFQHSPGYLTYNIVFSKIPS